MKNEATRRVGATTRLFIQMRHSFTTEIVKECVYPNSHSFFYNETQNFENGNQAAIYVFTTKYRISKVWPKRPIVFPTRKYEV